MGVNDDRANLGTVITSWRYKPQKSNKFLYAALGVIGAFIIFTVMYGPQLLPWLKSIPTIVIYAVLFLISPLLKLLSIRGRDQDWALYEHGYIVVYIGKNNEREERIGFWRNFRSCTYDSKGVKLIPAVPFQKAVRINAPRNVMEIYSICRERISMAQAESLETAVRVPGRPNTREQRQLSRAERKYSQLSSGRTQGTIKTQFKSPFQQ